MAPLIVDLSPIRQEFVDRMAAAQRLFDLAHASSTGIERESRGVVVVLMFAAYERLLHELSKSLIGGAASLGVGNRRLLPGFRALSLHGAAVSLRDASAKRLYTKTLVDLVSLADQSRAHSLDSTVFPDDGSYMRASQVVTWCSVFGVDNYLLTLKGIWQNLDGVVADRNAVAHGRLGPDEVGRARSEADVRDLLAEWQASWLAFIDDLQARAGSRDFYRRAR